MLLYSVIVFTFGFYCGAMIARYEHLVRFRKIIFQKSKLYWKENYNRDKIVLTQYRELPSFCKMWFAGKKLRYDYWLSFKSCLELNFGKN